MKLLPLPTRHAFSQHRLAVKTARRIPFWLEITLVLVVKVVLLFFLWRQFFAHPQTKHMLLPATTVQQHFFTRSDGNGLQASPHQASNPANEVKHGTD